MTSSTSRSSGPAGAATLVLLTLATGQFLMTLDSSVMNVSIATVAKDVGTTVTGIQGAITAYTLVMAALMITGAKIGALIGRKRAFAIGCVIYGCGSFTTSLAHEPARAAVRLVVPRGCRRRADPARHRRARRRQLPGRAPARRVRPGRGSRGDRHRRRPADRRLLHDLLLLALGLRRRGACSCSASSCWRGASPTRRPSDGRSSTSSARCSRRSGSALARLRRAPLERVGLGPAEAGRAVVGRPLADALADPRRPVRASGSSSAGEIARRGARRGAARAHPAMLRNQQLGGGLIMFFFQYLVQAGLFFVVPLYLSVCLGLSALATGVRLLPAVDHAAARPRSASRGCFPTSRRGSVVRCRPARRCSPARSCCSASSTRTLGRRDRVRADAADRPRHRRARLAARRRHGVRRARRREPRGRRRAEHRRPTSAPRSAPRWPARS